MVEYKDLRIGDKVREFGFSNSQGLVATVTETRDSEFDYKYDKPYYMRAGGIEGTVLGGTCKNDGNRYWNHYWEKI